MLQGSGGSRLGAAALFAGHEPIPLPQVQEDSCPLFSGRGEAGGIQGSSVRSDLGYLEPE